MGFTKVGFVSIHLLHFEVKDFLFQLLLALMGFLFEKLQINLVLAAFNVALLSQMLVVNQTLLAQKDVVGFAIKVKDFTSVSWFVAVALELTLACLLGIEG